MICGIVCLIFGILAVVNGKFSLTRNRVVEGTPARVVGVLLILPLPLTFAIGLALGTVMLTQNDPAMEKQFERVARVIDIAVPLLSVAAALTVAFVYANPPKNKRPLFEKEDDDLDDEDDRYRRRFDKRDDDRFPPDADERRTPR